MVDRHPAMVKMVFLITSAFSWNETLPSPRSLWWRDIVFLSFVVQTKTKNIWNIRTKHKLFTFNMYTAPITMLATTMHTMPRGYMTAVIPTFRELQKDNLALGMSIGCHSQMHGVWLNERVRAWNVMIGAAMKSKETRNVILLRDKKEPWNERKRRRNKWRM